MRLSRVQFVADKNASRDQNRYSVRFFEQSDLHRQLFQMLIDLHFLIHGTKRALSQDLPLVNIYASYNGTSAADI